MTYTIQFTEDAREELVKLPKPLRKKLIAKIEQLSETPYPHNAKKLKGYDTFYRIRFSEWRVVYEVVETQLIIAVIRVAQRSTVYEKL